MVHLVSDGLDHADALVTGYEGGSGLTGQSPRAAWMSVWQRPEVSIRTSTWCGAGVGTGLSSTVRGSVKLRTTAAFTGIPPFTGRVGGVGSHHPTGSDMCHKTY